MKQAARIMSCLKCCTFLLPMVPTRYPELRHPLRQLARLRATASATAGLALALTLLPIHAAAQTATAAAAEAMPKPAVAATPVPPAANVVLPNEWSAENRKAYAAGLKNARELIGQKKFDEAVVVLDQLTVERPREPQARFLKGVALTDAGKTDAAIATFRGVIAEYPELPEPHNNLAVLYASRGDYQLARGELESALNIAPDYLVAYENLGDVYTRLAAQNYEHAIARDPKNRSAPPKLKLVTEVLAGQPKPAAPAATTAPAASAVPAAVTAPAPAAAPAAAPTATVPPATPSAEPPK